MQCKGVVTNYGEEGPTKQEGGGGQLSEVYPKKKGARKSVSHAERGGGGGGGAPFKRGCAESLDLTLSWGGGCNKFWTRNFPIL